MTRNTGCAIYCGKVYTMPAQQISTAWSWIVQTEIPITDKYEKMVAFYDALYAFKDYAYEAERLHRIIQDNKHSEGTSLLDVACGTGQHVYHLRAQYQVEGLDLNSEMLAIAHQRCPQVSFHQGDMLDFYLDRSFDVVTCLFSSIGYLKTVRDLKKALANMARHLHPGGVLIIEPWLSPEAYNVGGPHALFVDEPELKIARMNLSELHDGVSIIDMHHLVATPDGVEYFVERHELTLFTDAEYRQAIDESGLIYKNDPQGLTGRGLFIGLKPNETAVN